MQHPLLMTRDLLRAEKPGITTETCETSRTIAFGCLIVYYVRMSGNNDFSSRCRHGFGIWAVHSIGLLGAPAILSDHLEYVCDRKSVQSALDESASDYDRNCFWYKSAELLSLAKQYAVCFGSLLLLSLVLYPIMWLPP